MGRYFTRGSRCESTRPAAEQVQGLRDGSGICEHVWSEDTRV